MPNQPAAPKKRQPHHLAGSGESRKPPPPPAPSRVLEMTSPGPASRADGGSEAAAGGGGLESSLEMSVSSTCSFGAPRARIFKIIVIGDSNVGKTCLTYRFCASRFPERTEATIGVDFRERSVEIDGEKIKIQLWDTAGQERFRKSMVQHYYRNVHAVVFVYDMTNMASFQSLPAWIEECKQHLYTNDVPRILVGNKCDLRDSIEVPTDLAQKFADSHSMPMFETSAKNTTDHVEAIFMTLAHKLKSHRPLILSQPPENTVGLDSVQKTGSFCGC
ncbi:ras-related protein Rab-33B isoform X1 [Ascaphus truei]|uniref:ras-related protein Rab-33B isoform X1 n=2 Tax=Ascaphus truei TaxID=8439 RepID=UPI003F5A60EE